MTGFVELVGKTVLTSCESSTWVGGSCGILTFAASWLLAAAKARLAAEETIGHAYQM